MKLRMDVSRLAAFFWGLVVFLPVGMGYLAFFLLAACLLAQGGWRARVRRLRQHPVFWPLAGFLGWTLVVLATQPRMYAETPSNLWHGLRIAATLAMALSLTRDEAISGVRGFALACLCSLSIIYLNLALGLPEWSAWRNLIHYAGNKSIANAILLSVAGGSATLLSFTHTGRERIGCAVLAGLCLAALVFALPNRASLLALFIALAACAFHRWRRRWRRLLPCVAAALAAATLLLSAVPAIHASLGRGFSEVRAAGRGEVSLASWNVRVHMIRHTAQMVAERPWMGWGIGGWNEQWKARVPALIADLNMPHNDLLWMGAQAGVLGALSWLAIMLAACRSGWRRTDSVGRMAFAASLTMLICALVNSATRDAVIGLSLLWIVGLYLRLADEPGFDVAVLVHRPLR